MSKDTVIVDARGALCPEPVIATKRALEANPGAIIETIVDNGISRDNVIKFGDSRGRRISVESVNGVYTITLTPMEDPGRDTMYLGGAAMIANMVAEPTDMASPLAMGDKVLLLTKPWIGGPDIELGKTLLQTFLFCLSESKMAPKHIYCMNGAATLVTKDSPVLEQLQSLAAHGVPISTCGICLDALHLKEEVAVGDVTNMYVITEQLMSEDVVILS